MAYQLLWVINAKKRLDWFCLLFRVWVLIIVFHFIGSDFIEKFWLDFDEKFFTFFFFFFFFFFKENLRCPLVWYFRKGPLACLSDSILDMFFWNCQFKRMCLTVRGTLHIEHIGVSSLFRKCEWVMWVWPMQSLDIITFLLLLLSADHLLIVSYI